MHLGELVVRQVFRVGQVRRLGIHLHVVEHEFVVQMRSGDKARRTDVADDVALLDAGAHADARRHLRHVGVERRASEPMVDLDVASVAAGFVAAQRHDAVGGGEDARAARRAKVRPVVRADDPRDGVAAKRRVFGTHVLHFERDAQEGLTRGLAVERVEALRLVAAEAHGFVDIVAVNDLHGEKSSVPNKGAVGELLFKEHADAVARLHVAHGIDFALPDGFELFAQSRREAERAGRLQEIASRPGRSVGFLGAEGKGMHGDRE